MIELYFMANRLEEGFFQRWILQYFAWGKCLIIMNTEVIEGDSGRVRVQYTYLFCPLVLNPLIASGRHSTKRPTMLTEEPLQGWAGHIGTLFAYSPFFSYFEQILISSTLFHRFLFNALSRNLLMSLSAEVSLHFLHCWGFITFLFYYFHFNVVSRVGEEGRRQTLNAQLTILN